MIEKPKRPTKIPNQDNKQPQTINELIRRYDLDNTKIYDFLDELVAEIKTIKNSSEEDKYNVNIALYKGEGIDANTTVEPLVLTNINTPVSESLYYIQTIVYGSKTKNTRRSQVAIGYLTNDIWHRYCKDGSWSDWVPTVNNVVTGRETPTNEYIDYKQVYRKRIDIGVLPNATTKEVATGLSNINCIRLEGIAKYEYGTWAPLPMVENSNSSNYNAAIKLVRYGESLQIKCDADQSALNGYVDIYYTKN